MNNKIWYGGKCKCCRGLNEPYMVTFELWRKVIGKQNDGFVCISCFEEKLGRKLKIEDFLEVPINNGIFGFKAKDYIKYGKDYLDYCKKVVANK